MALSEQATEAQTDFIQRLLRERETDALTEHQRTWLESKDFTTLSRGGASKVIDALKALPKVAGTGASQDRTSSNPNWPNVTAGRYAVDGEDGILKFYKVDRPTEGKWAGYIFVKVQASDGLHPIRGKDAVAAIMRKIDADPKKAMLRYGQEIGSCGHCGRTLTNELSRELGIGPICRGKMGW